MKLSTRTAHPVGNQLSKQHGLFGVVALLSNTYLQSISAKEDAASGRNQTGSIAHHSASPVFSQKGFRINIMHSDMDAYS